MGEKPPYEDKGVTHSICPECMKKYFPEGNLRGETMIDNNPVSTQCEAVLAKPPKCFDFRGVRSYVMCKAWDILEKERRTKLPVSEAWQEVRRVCVSE